MTCTPISKRDLLLEHQIEDFVSDQISVGDFDHISVFNQNSCSDHLQNKRNVSISELFAQGELAGGHERAAAKSLVTDVSVKLGTVAEDVTHLYHVVKIFNVGSVELWGLNFFTFRT